MVEIDPGPVSLRDMAAIALPIGIYMAGRLAGGSSTIVATRAGAGNGTVVEIDH